MRRTLIAALRVARTSVLRARQLRGRFKSALRTFGYVPALKVLEIIDTSDLVPLDLDRVAKRCGTCGQGCHIIAAWLSMTRLFLETECPHGHETKATCFDLLKIDKYLKNLLGDEELQVEVNLRKE